MPSAFSDQPDQTRRSVEFPGHAATVLTLLGLFGSTTIDPTRREFIGAMIVASAAGIWTRSGSTPADEKANATASLDVPLVVNGRAVRLSVEPRVTLLDALREHLQLTGTKKGCDHGQCGACTVHIDGRRVLSCLTLAVAARGRSVTTIEGLATGEALHPIQAAFIDYDGFQCGYCTAGQIMSGVGCIKEGHTGSPAEIREWMSGNICRCGAYTNIVTAVSNAARSI